MTNTTGPAQQRDQPTQPRPMFTHQEKDELWALVRAALKAATDLGQGFGNEISQEEFARRLEASIQTSGEAHQWLLSRLQGWSA